jgi:hypothetical protein
VFDARGEGNVPLAMTLKRLAYPDLDADPLAAPPAPQ